jgi:WXG100 family type VII secretion target
MVSFSVQFGSMEDATTQLNAIAGRLLELGERLHGQVMSGTSELQGATKDQFMIVQQQYEQAHAAIQQTMQGSSRSLGDIHTNYADNESRGAARWAH